MDFSLELIISIANLLGIFLPLIFKYALWSENLPKTIEDFNEKYESKINRIISDNTNKSSELLEKIINNKSQLNDESDSEKYGELLNMHQKLLIRIRFHGEIENKQKEIEYLYQHLHNTIQNIRNWSILVVIFYIICGIILLSGYFDKFQIFIQCGIYSLTFYGIFRISDLYFRFKKDSTTLLNHKKWILETVRNIPKMSDDV